MDTLTRISEAIDSKGASKCGLNQFTLLKKIALYPELLDIIHYA